MKNTIGASASVLLSAAKTHVNEKTMIDIKLNTLMTME